MRKGADLLSKWVGEAEKQLRLLFEEASKHQPAIIFFDEIDGLAPVRVCAWVCARVCVYVGDVVWYLGAGRFRTLVWLRVEGASYNPCCVVCQTRQLPPSRALPHDQHDHVHSDCVGGRATEFLTVLLPSFCGHVLLRQFVCLHICISACLPA